jgi:hypothetical protein
MSRTLWLLIALALLAGCEAAVKPVAPPQIVHVVVKEYIPIPDELIQDCPIAEPATLKVQEAVRVANARKVSLQNCNEDKAALRALKPPAVAPELQGSP